MSTAKHPHTTRRQNLRLLGLPLMIGLATVPALAFFLLGSKATDLVFSSPENGFLGVTAALFLMLWGLTAKKMRRWHRIADCAERQFGDAMSLRTDGNADIDLIREALDAVAEQARGTGGRPFARRIATLRRLIEFHASAPPASRSEMIARAIAGQDGNLTEAPDLRALEHTLVSALLFIGIIGTFFGLIEFLGSENFQNFVKHSRGSALFEHLPEVTHGLGTAFWTSLFAYVFYLIGRFVVDQCEEEYERSAREFVDSVQGGLACLFPTTGRGTVDLSDRSVTLLAETVREMKGTAEAVRALIDQSKAVAGELAAAAGALISAVIQVIDASDTFFASIKAGQEDWRAAASEWKATTEAFAKAAAPLAEDIRSLLDQIHILPSEFGKQAEAMITDLGEVTKRNGETLTTHAETVGKRLDESATRFTHRMDEFSGQLGERIKAHEAILRSVTDAVDEVYQQRQDMIAKLEQLHRESKGIRNGTVDAVKQITAKDHERMEELTNALRAMTESIATLRERTESMRHLLIGAGQPADLLSILRMLYERDASVPACSDRRAEAHS